MLSGFWMIKKGSHRRNPAFSGNREGSQWLLLPRFNDSAAANDLELPKVLGKILFKTGSLVSLNPGTASQGKQSKENITQFLMVN